MANKPKRERARRGSGSIVQRGQRYLARVNLGVGVDGKRIRRAKTFATREEAQTWIDQQRSRADELVLPVANQRVDDYLRWWIDNEAPKGKPGRAPLAHTTLTGYRGIIEHHLVPAFGRKRVGELTVRELDEFATRKLVERYAPATINRMREVLRSALSTAVRQDRLTRTVARYGGGVGVEPAPVDRFTDAELGRTLTAARDQHFYPAILTLARTGLRAGEACGLRWRDLALDRPRPRLSVVWQLDKWGGLVRPKSHAARRTIPVRAEVVAALEAWRDRQAVWADRLGEHWGDDHDLVFTTRTGGPVWTRNIARAFTRAQQAAGVRHGSLKTLRSTVATQLADAACEGSGIKAFRQFRYPTPPFTAVGDLDDLDDLLPDL